MTIFVDGLKADTWIHECSMFLSFPFSRGIPPPFRKSAIISISELYIIYVRWCFKSFVCLFKTQRFTSPNTEMFPIWWAVFVFKTFGCPTNVYVRNATVAKVSHRSVLPSRNPGSSMGWAYLPSHFQIDFLQKDWYILPNPIHELQEPDTFPNSTVTWIDIYSTKWACFTIHGGRESIHGSHWNGIFFV